MELRLLIDTLSEADCSRREREQAQSLYESGQTEDLIRYLKKCRCKLVEEMHKSQRRVDHMDHLIRQAEKEQIGSEHVQTRKGEREV